MNKNTSRDARLVLSALGVLLILTVAACSNTGSEAGPQTLAESYSSFSDHESNSGTEESGEEPGQQYTLTETFDRERAGAHLVLSYDTSLDAFTGSIANTTTTTLSQVRVEVHLSNGVELGPTTPIDLGPGQSAPVSLAANGQSFSTWGAHPEVGSGSEYGEGSSGESVGEHEGVSNGGEHGSGSESGEHREG